MVALLEVSGANIGGDIFRVNEPRVSRARLPRVRHVGSPVKRPDDPCILTGRGHYVDDVVLPRTAGAPAAILDAVNDALVPFGAMITEQPMTPQRVLLALGRLSVE